VKLRAIGRGVSAISKNARGVGRPVNNASIRVCAHGDFLDGKRTSEGTQLQPTRRIYRTHYARLNTRNRSSPSLRECEQHKRGERSAGSSDRDTNATNRVRVAGNSGNIGQSSEPLKSAIVKDSSHSLARLRATHRHKRPGHFLSCRCARRTLWIE